MASAPEVAFLPVEVRTRQGRTLVAREYTSEDFGALVEMYESFEPKRIAQGLPPPDVPRIVRWLEQFQHKSRSLLALDGQLVVGHALLCPISDAAVEFTIFVHQDFRREDLGAELTRLMIAFATDWGFAEIFLTTELTNFAALRLYRKAGFETQSACGDECEMRLRIADARAVRKQAA